MNFSKKILKKLNVSTKKGGVTILPVAKSGSIIRPGDVLIFNYRTESVTQQKTVVAVRPVERDAATGNTLLTCVKVDLINEDITPEYIKGIYTSRSMFTENQYRTYIMSKIIGNIFRFTVFEPKKR